MDEYPDDTDEEREADDASEDADPPRPVRGVLWLFAPGAAGAAVGAAWSAYYAALRGVDPLAPVLVGGGVGLALGAFLWVFFPYKAGRHS
ncbi:MAG TPA: hypothetical protein DDY78_13375 [Planctomycetales bacterium]|jgi:hypothetical protein|nr:hypothetical protein [Planctomycetales bacterium]